MITPHQFLFVLVAIVALASKVQQPPHKPGGIIFPTPTPKPRSSPTPKPVLTPPHALPTPKPRKPRVSQTQQQRKPKSTQATSTIPISLPGIASEGFPTVRLTPSPIHIPVIPPTVISRSTPLVGSAGMPLHEVDFETVTVDERGRFKGRPTKSLRLVLGFTEELGDKVRLEMIEIHGGKFIMGAPRDELDSTPKEWPQHEVDVTDFAISKYEMTQAQWRAVARLPKVRIDLNPDPSKFRGDDLPVEQVSWEEAVEFCERLSRKTGQIYRLPSEAEWEYACRAGTVTPFHFGETITVDLVNYDGKSPYKNAPKGTYRGQTTPTGYFSIANAFGLFDMHGNVAEWCADLWHENYDDAPPNQRSWEEGGNVRYRVVRGGNWFDLATISRAASREYFPPNHRAFNIGFRVVVAK